MTKQLNNLVWTALITPFDDDGAVQLDDFTRLLRMQEAAGNGILLFGSTGEGLALTTSEKVEMLEVVSNMNLQVPVMAGVGGFQAKAQKEWMDACHKARVDAFLLVAPLYARPGVRGQIAWFRELLDHATCPCMFYNIPARTGVKIAPEALQGVSGHKNSWAVKEAGGNTDDYAEFVQKVPELTFYAGDDFMLPFYSRIGTEGVVSVASNVWPEQTRLFAGACFEQSVMPGYHRWTDAVKELFSAPNPIPVKALMMQKGLIRSDRLRLPLMREDLKSLDKLILADRVASAWRPDGKHPASI